jgi:hypothetical protein
MSHGKEMIRRGFVMTGGGAKGLYEAGVIHAFHICGMDFHVITGSSIGAMNAIFYAEYLYRKSRLPKRLHQDPERAIEALEELVLAYLHAWWQMPERGIIDDSDEGPLGRLKDDLQKFNLNLPGMTRLYWWWSDPSHGKIPPPQVGISLLRLVRELAERLEGWGPLLRIFKEHRQDMLQEALRTYLGRFDMQNSLVPPGGDQRLTSFFNDPISPITALQVMGENGTPLGRRTPIRIVEPGRTLRDYSESAGVDVRLTRVNYRTGRLEISAYLSDQNFAAYLSKQSKRTGSEAIEALPIGAFRLQNPGNPEAVNAALASGRFPGVFMPYPLTAIYNLERPENHLLARMLENWLDGDETRQLLREAYQSLDPAQNGSHSKWQELINRWQKSEMMREYFPKETDIYVDGGAVDNTPSNTAIDSVCEWAVRQKIPRGDLELDLYEVLLHPEPKVSPSQADDPAFFDVVLRTLNIQGAARLSADMFAVQNINTFGRRGHDTAKTLLSLARAVRPLSETLNESQKAALEQCLWDEIASQGKQEFLGESSEGILDRIETWGAAMIERLPLQVNVVRICPDQMKLNTLQFTQRLGYRLENAVESTTMGCYNAMWALRKHLEKRQRDFTRTGKTMSQHDQNALRLARRWMGIENWPDEPQQQEDLEEMWSCARIRCVFHERACRHGAINARRGTAVAASHSAPAEAGER